MTQLAEVQFQVKCDQSIELPHWNGALLRDWLVGQMPKSIVELAHPKDGRLPYTVSNLLPLDHNRQSMRQLDSEQTYTLRITALTDPVSQWLLDWAQTDQVMTLEDNDLHLTTSGITHTTDDALTSQKALNIEPSSNRINIRLLSPTAFKHHGMVTSIPTPYLVFRGLIDTWNRFNTNVQLHPDTASFVDECVTSTVHRLRGEAVNMPYTAFPPVTGSMGFVRFVIMSKDRFWRGVVHTLAAYGAYAGIGVRTAVGMGQMSVESKNNDHR